VSDQPKQPAAIDKADKPAEPKKDQSLNRDELEKVSGGRATVVRPFVQGGPVFSQVQSYRREIQGDASEPKRSLTEIFEEVSAE
jgi:hypothetical protein